MLFLFQGCLGLSFKNWTGLQDCRIYRIGFPLAKLGVDNGQDGRIAGFTG